MWFCRFPSSLLSLYLSRCNIACHWTASNCSRLGHLIQNLNPYYGCFSLENYANIWYSILKPSVSNLITASRWMGLRTGNIYNIRGWFHKDRLMKPNFWLYNSLNLIKGWIRSGLRKSVWFTHSIFDDNMDRGEWLSQLVSEESYMNHTHNLIHRFLKNSKWASKTYSSKE